MEKKKEKWAYAELRTSVYGHTLYFTHRTRMNWTVYKKNGGGAMVSKVQRRV